MHGITRILSSTQSNARVSHSCCGPGPLAILEVYSNDLMDEYDFTISCLKVRVAEEDTLEWILMLLQLTLDGQHDSGLSIVFISPVSIT